MKQIDMCACGGKCDGVCRKKNLTRERSPEYHINVRKDGMCPAAYKGSAK